MKTESNALDPVMRGRIDRLVCGELGGDDRQELLAWLERDVRRWRGCALAFLEAQAWEESLADGQNPETRSLGPGVKCQEPGTKVPPAVNSRRGSSAASRWLTALVAVAASVAAFACGTWWQGLRVSPEQPDQMIAERRQKSLTEEIQSLEHGPLLASVPVKGGPLGNVEAVLQFPVLPPEASKGTVSSSVPQRMRKEWERRGYELKEERRYLPAKLPDGRQVMVPVNEVKMKFVGRPVS